MFYVYVLKSKKDKKCYIGFTNDLRRRFQEHNDGKNRSTFYRRPFELIYYECYRDRDIAKRRETQVKGGKAHTALLKRLKER